MATAENYAAASAFEQQKKPSAKQPTATATPEIAPALPLHLQQIPQKHQNKDYLIESALLRFEENVREATAHGAGNSNAQAPTAPPPPHQLRRGPKHRLPQASAPPQNPHTARRQPSVHRPPVQFQLDRYGHSMKTPAAGSACRQTWAGANYGSMHIPRHRARSHRSTSVNGDPDLPHRSPGAYTNAMQMRPGTCPPTKPNPASKPTPAKTVRQAAGEKNGARATPTPFAFEDRKAQNNYAARQKTSSRVENDEDKWRGTEIVDRNEKINVHGWRTEEVDLDEKDETITIHQNAKERVDLDESVDIGDNQRFTVGIDRTKKVGKNEADTIGKNWSVSTGKMGKPRLSASATRKAPGSSKWSTTRRPAL
ncbi:hypothetical protein FQA39_LY18565 [Lamprigera yunnana]|nr:hypothetical protein FQA39_LY18565 [Lamprigera yunnana]